MQAIQPVTPRPGIKAPDGDLSTIPLHSCQGASMVRLGAICTTAGASLSCRIIFLDGNGAYVASSASVTFTVDAKPLDGTLYLSTPEPDAWFPIGGPSIFGIHVDSVSDGMWTLTPLTC